MTLFQSELKLRLINARQLWDDFIFKTLINKKQYIFMRWKCFYINPILIMWFYIVHWEKAGKNCMIVQLACKKNMLASEKFIIDDFMLLINPGCENNCWQFLEINDHFNCWLLCKWRSFILSDVIITGCPA